MLCPYNAEFFMDNRKKKEYHSSLIVLMLLNMAFSAFICRGLLAGSSPGLVQVFQFLAHMTFLNFIPALIVFPLMRYSGKVGKYAGIVLYALLQIFLLLDLNIYRLFHLHINGMIIRTVLTEGFTDSVTLGSSTIVFFLLKAAGVLLLESVFVYLSFRAEGTLSRRLRYALVAVFLLTIAADKVIYAAGSFYNAPGVTRIARLYPLYVTLRADRTLIKVFGLTAGQDDDLRQTPQDSLLNYPRKQLVRNERVQPGRPNILVIAAEGFRFDMLDPEITPNLWKFSREHIVLKNHYSGGNGTRMGIFSLFYGLQSTYWDSFLIERRSPVLLDELKKLGYEFRILSATRLTYPEFRKTVFVNVPDAVEDEFPSSGAERERLMTERFIEFTKRRDTSRPFFSFIFFNASHQPYVYPKEHEKFRPAAGEDINYSKTIGEAAAIQIRNRFKNSLHYDDALFGRIFDALKQSGALEHTIVIVTGDHGEEFLEQGHFGHTQSFSDYVAKTVFVMHVPGIRGMAVERLTSHYDVVPTLMELLGYTNAASDYAQGSSIFSTAGRPYVCSGDWGHACMIDRDVKIVFSTDSYRNLFEVFSAADYKKVGDPAAVLKQKRLYIVEMLKMMSEFYRERHD
ncbi:MAG: hypothetical protein C0402_02120 [Thermodesulfovibrio sp.]|nr:hypothetical protein [Thermodesulfovibrio sp.]